MTREYSTHSGASPSTDDAYWAALFKQEEKASTPLKRSSADGEGTELGRHPTSSNSRSSGMTGDHDDPWCVAFEYLESDRTMELTVTGYNKGGLLVHWNGLQGFVPASQLVDFLQFHLEDARLQGLKERIGEKLSLKVIEANRRKNRLVLSERTALIKADQREQLLNRVQPGDTVRGRVTNLADFGAFVDLGGVEGLIHISELSWSRVGHPSDIVKPGQSVEVVIVNVEAEKKRIGLSMKRLKPDPWQNAENRYEPGQLVEGTVTNVVHFGAFVMLEEELEGLIHISELAEGTFSHPRNVVRTGEKVVAQVLSVNGASKRLALRLLRIMSSNSRG